MAVFNFRVDTFDKALNFGVRYFRTNPNDDKGKPPQMMLSKGNDLKNCLIWGWWILSILPVPATYFFSAAMSLNRLGWVSKVVKAAWPPMASESSEFGDGFPKKKTGTMLENLHHQTFEGPARAAVKFRFMTWLGKERWHRAWRPDGLGGSFLEAQRVRHKQPVEIAGCTSMMGSRKYQWKQLLKSYDWQRLTTCQS